MTTTPSEPHEEPEADTELDPTDTDASPEPEQPAGEPDSGDMPQEGPANFPK